MMQSRRPDPHALLQRRALESYDPFNVNPLRRSLTTVAVCLAIVVLPPAFCSPAHAALVLITVGWLAMAVLILSLPVALISIVETFYRAISHRIHPSVDELDLSPRVQNLLRRHDFATIASVDRTSDTSLLMLSNFDQRALHEVRRAVNLWKYRRWQEAGFPDNWRWS